MALVYDRVTEEARAIQAVCTDMAFMLVRIQQILTHNGNQLIDWGAATKPAYIDEDAAGNMNGMTFSRVAVANAVGSLEALRKLMTNQSVAGLQGDHVGNLNQIAGASTVQGR